MQRKSQVSSSNSHHENSFKGDGGGDRGAKKARECSYLTVYIRHEPLEKQNKKTNEKENRERKKKQTNEEHN